MNECVSLSNDSSFSAYLEDGVRWVDTSIHPTGDEGEGEEGEGGGKKEGDAEAAGASAASAPAPAVPNTFSFDLQVGDPLVEKNAR